MESRKILIVEDEFITASDLKAILEKDGYTVAGVARTGEEAIKLAGQDPLDLVLMDIKLGSSMDGIETARILRESTGVPVVYLTAHSDREFLERAKLTEPNGYLIKPYNPGQVSATLEMALYKAGMEKRLAESEAQYRFLAENMSDMAWIIGADLRTTYVSPSIEKVLGFTPEERNQQSIEEAVTPESLREVQKRLAEELQRNGETGVDLDRSVVIDVEYYRKDGSTVWMENRVQAIRDSERCITGMFGVSRDITERKQAEAERAALEAQNRQLQKAESLGRMAGAIAHHFNNQLQAVMGNLEMAIGDLPQAGGPVEALAEAMKAAHRAARVSGQMLTYLGQTPSKRNPLDLSEACRLGLPMLEAAMPKDMVLETDLPTHGPAIRANTNQMQQVLTHLVTNAWESMAEAGGVIYLSVKTAHAEGIPATLRFPINWQPKEKAYACLEVRDSGPGISEQDIEKLFDPFFSTKFTGRGLGLPVVLGIVKAHGGAITVESGGGTGSGGDGSQRSEVGGQRSVAPGKAWSVGIGGERAALEIR